MKVVHADIQSSHIYIYIYIYIYWKMHLFDMEVGNVSDVMFLGSLGILSLLKSYSLL